MDSTDPTISGLEGDKYVNGETDLNKETIPANQHEKSTSTIENPENPGMKKKRGRKKGQKLIPRQADKTRYSLRSSADGGRIRRSTSNDSNDSLNPDQTTNSELAAGTSSQIEPVLSSKRRGRKPKRVSSGDKLSTIRNRVRSLVTRMNYEQNLIDAYSTDGWKGQNLEKLRPEKEIERAKAAIIKCKLKIRDSFKELGILATQGKLDNSLFDDKGEIDCEDIFCAKCGLKNATLNNDIILCDGICDRGFHQNCLNPPLLTKDIPPGDEGWLCPACDCKLDCIVLLNESKGSNLCLQDTWEKVFPEAAAAANGSGQLNPLDLPSDDSEDDDFNPDAPEEDNHGENEGEEEHEEESDQAESSSDDSDFYTDSEDENTPKKAKTQKKKLDIEALPSEDSEDDDFDPERRNSEEESCEKMSNSEESDFTSDSDEFCDELVKKSDGDGDVSAQSVDQGLVDSDVPMTGRRQKEPTDYKKLYRETFGKASSDSESSDDEEWSEKRIKKGKGHDLSESSSPKQSRSSKNKINFGLDKTKTLNEYFKSNQYPNRQSKEILAEELELTYAQVNKWFEAARRQARGNSAEMPNGSRKRGRPAMKHVNTTVASISGANTNSGEMPNGSRRRGRPATKNTNITMESISVANTILSAPHTPNSAINTYKSPTGSLGTTPPQSAFNAQKSPTRSVGMTTPNSAVNVQNMTPSSAGTSKSTEPAKDFLDSERKKAIMRELRKQKMGR